MAIGSYSRTFAGRQVVWYIPGVGLRSDPSQPSHLTNWGGENAPPVPDNPSQIAIRVRLPVDDEDFYELEGFTAPLDDPSVGLIEAMVFGRESVECRLHDELIAARDRLAGLKALFLGDIVWLESELSWIAQPDVRPVLDAYPDLETLRGRASAGLSFDGFRHHTLRSLAVETAAMDQELIRQILTANLPNLEHLELWLGTDQRDGLSHTMPLRPLLRGRVFPKLKRLGLRNTSLSDDIAIQLSSSSLLDRLEELDLSLGTLSDEGAEALLRSGRMRKLQRLDIHHHFVSPAMVEELREAVPEGDFDPGEGGEASGSDRFGAHNE